MKQVQTFKRGGKREGAGRKPGITFKEPTVVMRIPISKVAAVLKILKGSTNKKPSHPHNRN